MRILDATAGRRAIWWDKEHPTATFIDARADGRDSTLKRDFRKTGFPSGYFDLVIFDPPHMTCGPRSAMAKRYGHYLTSEIRDMVRDGFAEFHRILRPDGLVAFKWATHDTSLARILEPVVGFEPLVGVPTAQRTKHSSVTYWCLLRRRDA